MSQNSFNQKKASILQEIQSTSVDLSPKGTIDELCLPIIDLINSHKDMVTTSSCSGRVSVFVEGNKVRHHDVKLGGKGEGGRWLFVTHNFQEVLKWYKKYDLGVVNAERNALAAETRLILYKFEPFILHVKCRDFEIASKLYNTAMSCGFRESGIGSNNIVAVRISIKLDVPIGYLDESTESLKLFVPEEYLDLIDNMALEKFQENSRKMDELYNKIEQEIINAKKDHMSSEKTMETKDQRRERKRREGLEKQKLVQEARAQRAKEPSVEEVSKSV